PIGAATALALSAIGGVYLLTWSNPAPALHPISHALSVALFFLVGGCIAGVGVALRRLLGEAADRLAALAEEARRRGIAEEALRARSDELATEKEALSRLYELAGRAAEPTSLREYLTHVLHTAIWMTGADKGNVQLWDGASDELELVVHTGFSAPFVEF